jgi:hypothetical protein
LERLPDLDPAELDPPFDLLDELCFEDPPFTAITRSAISPTAIASTARRLRKKSRWVGRRWAPRLSGGLPAVPTPRRCPLEFTAASCPTESDGVRHPWTI